MTKLIVALIRIYQLLLSPFLGNACRFQPSCSVYAAEAIRKYGAIRGGLIAFNRILRCNPWGGSGYDPVIKTGDDTTDATMNNKTNDKTNNKTDGKVGCSHREKTINTSSV